MFSVTNNSSQAYSIRGREIPAGGTADFEAEEIGAIRAGAANRGQEQANARDRNLGRPEDTKPGDTNPE